MKSECKYISFWNRFHNKFTTPRPTNKLLVLHKIMSEKFSLKWNDFHTNVSKSFRRLRDEDYLHDVTPVSDDYTQIPAHKLVLSACSEYFQEAFKRSNKVQYHTLLCL